MEQCTKRIRKDRQGQGDPEERQTEYGGESCSLIKQFSLDLDSVFTARKAGKILEAGVGILVCGCSDCDFGCGVVSMIAQWRAIPKINLQDVQRSGDVETTGNLTSSSRLDDSLMKLDTENEDRVTKDACCCVVVEKNLLAGDRVWRRRAGDGF